MGTAWLVVAEIGFRRRARELVRQEGEQRHYIGLFDHLRPLRSLTADHHVDRHLAVGVKRQIERLQLVIAGKLLVEPGGRIETGNDASNRVAPVGKFRLAQREPFPQRCGTVGPAGAHHFDSLEPSGDVPARHHVSKCVVVYVLVVLVRPDHVADMPLAIRLRHGARRPETSGLQQNLRAGIAEEPVVARCTPVLPDRNEDKN